MTLTTTDPRTGTTQATDIAVTSSDEVAAIVERAHAAFRALRDLPRSWRADLLESMADALEQHRAELVAQAEVETGLTTARLDGELSRSAFQFRLFAEAVREGSYLEAAIDHAGATPLGPAPDIRRMLVPLGPIAVFGSSNFPFAFSVAGGDTASAIAAGNPIVAKAHSSHPLTSRLSADVLRRAATAAGAPAGTIGIVYGQSAGSALVAHPRIAAVGFTGSLHTGRILLAIIEKRDQPIPFYGELASLNPLVITEGAAAARAEEIVDGLYISVTGSAGQLCTKPGIAFVPRSGQSIVDGIAARAREAAAQPLLSDRIHGSFLDIQHSLVTAGAARELVAATAGETGSTVTPGVLEIDAADVTPAVAEEAFGPLVVLVRYRSIDEVSAALRSLPDSLTATVHAEDDEHDLLAALVDDLRDRAGRIVINGYPTGVRVSWAQHHGGPWPATNTQHTSVGVSAMRRFLRPLAWQNSPQSILPPELRDGVDSLPRRIDGVLRTPPRMRR